MNSPQQYWQSEQSAQQIDPTAVFGRRIGAFIIDYAFMLIIATIVFIGVFASSGDTEVFDSPEQAEAACTLFNDQIDEAFCIPLGSDVVVWENTAVDDAIFASLIAAIVFGALNWVLLSWLTGASLGKLMTGVRVVHKATFAKAGFLRQLGRWLAHLIDALPYILIVPLVGLITGIVTKGHRRVGDFLASTLVVHKDFVDRPTLVPGVNDAYPQIASQQFTQPFNMDSTSQDAPSLAPPSLASGTGGAMSSGGSLGTTESSGTGLPMSSEGFVGSAAGEEAEGSQMSDVAPATGDEMGEGDGDVGDADPGDAGMREADSGNADTMDTGMGDADSRNPDSGDTDSVVGGSGDADSMGAGMGDAESMDAGMGDADSMGADMKQQGSEDDTQTAASSQRAGVDEPMWDNARGAYIQWDPKLSAWMQWDEAQDRWVPISQ